MLGDVVPIAYTLYTPMLKCFVEKDIILQEQARATILSDRDSYPGTPGQGGGDLHRRRRGGDDLGSDSEAEYDGLTPLLRGEQKDASLQQPLTNNPPNVLVTSGSGTGDGLNHEESDDGNTVSYSINFTPSRKAVANPNTGRYSLASDGEEDILLVDGQQAYTPVGTNNPWYASVASTMGLGGWVGYSSENE